MDNLKKALHDDDLDFNSKGICAYLALIAKGNESYTTELSNISGSSEVTIKRSFARLENKRYVERIPPTRANDRRKVSYRFITTSAVGV